MEVYLLLRKGAAVPRPSESHWQSGRAIHRNRRKKTASLSRREFMCASALTVAMCAWKSTDAQPLTRDEQRVIVGAHPWVYAATQPGFDIYPILDRIFADIAYSGVDGIELMHTALYPAASVEKISRLSDEHHLPVIGMSYSGAMWDRSRQQDLLDEAQRIIPRLEKLGGKTLGTSVGSTPKPKTPAQLDAQAELLRKLIKLCHDHGIVLNLHNHTYEVENHLHDLKGTLERIPDVKLGPDLNWLIRGGVDPVAFIREFGDRIVFLHLRDQRSDGTWSEAMGEGATDFVSIGKALHDAHFTGHAVIELAHESSFHPTRPLRESLKMSRNFVKQTLGY
jgi:sugar phosphate isomerase/epimerase